MNPDQLPESWQEALAGEFSKSYFLQLREFLAEQRAEHQVFPPEADVFNAFRYAPYDQVKVVLLGQDPYHDVGQAQGLCFSVRPGVRIPPSLVNMLKELKADLGCKVPNNGSLVPWAEQGVLLLNAVLTVRAHEANSHKNRGWETFTDAVIRTLNDRDDPVVFVLWGAYAQKKGEARRPDPPPGPDRRAHPRPSRRSSSSAAAPSRRSTASWSDWANPRSTGSCPTPEGRGVGRISDRQLSNPGNCLEFKTYEI